MRISAKAKYALSSMLYMAQYSKSKEFITIQTLSDKLNISRIYLEQVFALLKRSNLVISAKGSQGGYQLAQTPKNISIYSILMATENSLFEKSAGEKTNTDLFIEEILQNFVLDKLDSIIEDTLVNISLDDLLSELEKTTAKEGGMYQI
ncbi:MAG: Rrf2 family transcriptional regulator [Elusimicrobiota bacterium]|jgi:Rrf2 family protein|nr:Rrf2 family transcriptional regulator [Elusimicrobiota bacterium]